MYRLLALSIVALSTTAFAGEMPPKAAPNSMLEAAFKDAAGTWTCTGTWNDPASGKSMTMTSKAKIAKALNGHQYTAEFSSPKTGDMPAMKSNAEWHYDPISKGLVGNMVCDSGDVSRSTSNGVQGQTIIWVSEGTMMGNPMKMRATHTTKSAKEMTMVYEVEANGNWAKMGDETCKKN
ncbi:MAG: hypothetical protein ACAI38_05175 [Myxococcota bacterium]